MTVIETFNFSKDLSDLRTSYQNIYYGNDTFLFLFEVSKSIIILSNFLEIVRNKRNIFSNNMSSDLLKNICSFLPVRYISSCPGVCKNWNSILSDFSKIKLFSKLPTNYYMKNNIFLNESIAGIKTNDKNIFTSNYDSIKIYDNNLELISTIDVHAPIFAVNNEYLLFKHEEYIKLFSLDRKKIIKQWEENNKTIGLAIHNQYIYCIDRKKSYIYDFDGRLLRQWDLGIKKNNYNYENDIANGNDEIFVTFPQLGYIKVFSLEGKLLRNIKCYNNHLDKTYVPIKIIISNNVIYVTTTKINIIMAFDYKGKFFFQIDNHVNISFIAHLNDRLYVKNMNNRFILIYNLLYDDIRKNIK